MFNDLEFFFHLKRGVDTGLNEFALMQMNLLNLHEYVGVSKIYDY
jgi:hypothetical protein